MTNIEIPLGKRTKQYRFFEMLPAILSYGAIILLIVLSLINPLWAAIYLLLFILTQFIKALGIAFRTIHGRSLLDKAQKVDWAARLKDLEDPAKNAPKRQNDLKHNESWRFKVHVNNLQRLATANEVYPKPSELYNAVIIAAYNEDIAVIEPTVQAVINSDYDMKRTILIFAYEGRDGAQSEEACLELVKKYGDKFKYAHAVKHPLTEGEVRGKGGNITYAGKYLKKWLKERAIDSDKVIVTTLDSDNRPHKTYFSYVTYEYIVHPDRLRVAFQPISLFLNNIWDAPAPMRVVATGNSFWNIISSTRPYSLRNFASHSQGMKALEMMNFWSVRTIVEDGHQYWRSYFFFKGQYAVIPIYVPIYQDAVLTESYKKTLKAQFIQLRRWAYGASDIAYVATNIFTKDRKVPFFPALARLIRLIDGHVSLAAMPLIIAFGAWVPLFLNNTASRSIIAHELPVTVSRIQQIALIGIIITVFLSFKMLPPRPERYKKHRSVFMILQWFLMPVTAICYTSFSAFYSQTRLLIGKYLDKFDVTQKSVKK